MSFLAMAENVAKAAFEPTPEAIASQCQYLLSLPHNNFVTLDPAFGLGALVQPLTTHPHAHIIGFEIAGDRAKMGQEAIPSAKVYHSDLLRADLSAESVSLLLANPPYLEQDARRLEYHMLHHVFRKRWLTKRAVVVAILTMRQWKSHIIDLFARYCYDIQAFKLPDSEFDRFKQAVIIAYIRDEPLSEPDPGDVARLRGWYYDTKRARQGKQPWRQGFSLPDLPNHAGIVTYQVPSVRGTPQITLKNASTDVVLEKLKGHGIQKSREWRDALTYNVQAHRLLPPLMPLIGKAHLAALILAGILDGQILQGPDTQRYIFSSFISTKWEEIAINDEDRQKNVVEKRQLQDLPILGVLNCGTGETSYYYGAKAYQYLDPWLPLLAKRVLQEHRPRYDLTNFDDWMVREAATIGTDKQLPGAPFSGLAIAQLHRVFAHWIALETLGKDGFQGEPGTGKTRMLICLMSLMAYYWQKRDDSTFQQQTRVSHPAWVKGIKIAWKANRWTHGEIPTALPLAIITPKRVIKSTWEGEFAKAWPAAKVIVIHDHRDVKQWMQWCADGYCYEESKNSERIKRTFPAVVALFSQSKTRPARLEWGPSVIEVANDVKDVPDLYAEGEPVYDGLDNLIGRKDPQTGAIITKKQVVYRFYCPDCQGLIKATPRSLLKHSSRTDVDEATLEDLEIEEQRPVESIEWFKLQPRFCQNERTTKERRGNRRARSQEQICGAPLWTMQRIPALEKKFPSLSYTGWFQAIQCFRETEPTHFLQKKMHRSVPNTLRFRNRAGDVGDIPPDSFSPYEYYRHFYRNCCAFVGVDESHNAQAPNSHISRAIHHMMRASQTCMLASGTHYPGTLERFFYYWFRFAPEFWLRLGITWKMVHRAIREYGVLVQTTKERITTKKGLAETEVSITTKAAPGVSSRLLPLLLALMCYIDVLDVGAHMPKRRQIPVVVQMHDPIIQEKRQALQQEQEQAHVAQAQAEAMWEKLLSEENTAEEEVDRAEFEWSLADYKVQELHNQLSHLDTVDLEAGYTQVEEELLEKAREGNSTAQMMMGILPRWWVIAPFEPAFTITKNEKGEWGEDLGSQIIFTAPVLSDKHEYPLERSIREHVAAEVQEIAEGSSPPRSRRVMLYYEQSSKRNVGARYATLLKEYNPWILPDTIEPEDREDAIRAAVEAGHQVILVAYKRVSEGLNLQFLDTIMWIEMPQNLTLFDQAGRRIWRLGKREECREYLFAYEGTVAYAKMQKLASEAGSASLFMGNSPVGELATLVGADQTALAQVTRKLESVEDLAAAFEARDQERAEVLARGREWLGLDRHDPLPELYQQVRGVTFSDRQKAVQEAESILQKTVVDSQQTPIVQTNAATSPSSSPSWLELSRVLGKQTQQRSEQKRQGKKVAKPIHINVEVRYIPPLNEEEQEPAVSLMRDLWGEMSPLPSKNRRRKSKFPAQRK